MPIYEYSCKSCSEVFSVLALSKNSIDTTCPNCKSSDTDKRLSAFSSFGFGSSGTGASYSSGGG